MDSQSTIKGVRLTEARNENPKMSSDGEFCLCLASIPLCLLSAKWTVNRKCTYDRAHGFQLSDSSLKKSAGASDQTKALLHLVPNRSMIVSSKGQNGRVGEKGAKHLEHTPHDSPFLKSQLQIILLSLVFSDDLSMSFRHSPKSEIIPQRVRFDFFPAHSTDNIIYKLGRNLKFKTSRLRADNRVHAVLNFVHVLCHCSPPPKSQSPSSVCPLPTHYAMILR